MIRWLIGLFTAREIRGYQPLPSTRREPPPMPATKPARDFTDWDVAEAATSEPAHEPSRVDYKFLGVTGEEQ